MSKSGLMQRYSVFHISLAYLFLMAVVSPLRGAGFTIEDLGVGVTVSGQSEQESAGSFPNSSPFIDAHEVSIGMSHSNATYDFNWIRTFARFLVVTSQDAGDVPVGSSLFSRASGQLRFISSQDLLLNLSAFYVYSGLGSEFVSDMRVDVVDRTPPQATCIACYSETGGPADLEPPSGVFSQTLTDILLPANRSYRITYNFALQTFGGGSSALAHGDGQLFFTLSVVPEPATLFLFAAALPILCRRRRR